MIRKELILRNPLNELGFDTEDILPDGGFGAVVADAGVGKTALLVQMAINGMLRSRNVLHISLNDPVNKVNLWYSELFHNLAEKYENAEIKSLWQSLLPHRFIMTFRVESFSVPKLEERLIDLTEQEIFLPAIMIVDGFNFDTSPIDDLKELKILAAKYQMRVWFTVHAGRRDLQSGKDRFYDAFTPISDLFDLVLELKTEHKNVFIKQIKGNNSVGTPLLLDPSTMLIKDQR